MSVHPGKAAHFLAVIMAVGKFQLLKCQMLMLELVIKK